MWRCVLLDYRGLVEHSFLADQKDAPEVVRWDHRIYCPIDPAKVQSKPASLKETDRAAFFKRSSVYDVRDPSKPST